MTRAEILANRRKWIARLKRRTTMKYQGALESTDNPTHRCCLGHGCNVLKIKRAVDTRTGVICYGTGAGAVFGGESAVAPIEFVDAVGLTGNVGIFDTEDRYEYIMCDGVEIDSLAELNDITDWTPQQIGELLENMIEGGEGTPFVPLDHYPA